MKTEVMIVILERIASINRTILSLEDFSSKNNIDISKDSVYIASKAQISVLRSVLEDIRNEKWVRVKGQTDKIGNFGEDS